MTIYEDKASTRMEDIQSLMKSLGIDPVTVRQQAMRRKLLATKRAEEVKAPETVDSIKKRLVKSGIMFLDIVEDEIEKILSINVKHLSMGDAKATLNNLSRQAFDDIMTTFYKYIVILLNEANHHVHNNLDNEDTLLRMDRRELSEVLGLLKRQQDMTKKWTSQFNALMEKLHVCRSMYFKEIEWLRGKLKSLSSLCERNGIHTGDLAVVFYNPDDFRVNDILKDVPGMDDSNVDPEYLRTLVREMGAQVREKNKEISILRDQLANVDADIKAANTSADVMRRKLIDFSAEVEKAQEERLLLATEKMELQADMLQRLNDILADERARMLKGEIPIEVRNMIEKDIKLGKKHRIGRGPDDRKPIFEINIQNEIGFPLTPDNVNDIKLLIRNFGNGKHRDWILLIAHQQMMTQLKQKLSQEFGDAAAATFDLLNNEMTNSNDKLQTPTGSNFPTADQFGMSSSHGLRRGASRSNASNFLGNSNAFPPAPADAASLKDPSPSNARRKTVSRGSIGNGISDRNPEKIKNKNFVHDYDQDAEDDDPVNLIASNGNASDDDDKLSLSSETSATKKLTNGFDKSESSNPMQTHSTNKKSLNHASKSSSNKENNNSSSIDKPGRKGRKNATIFGSSPSNRVSSSTRKTSHKKEPIFDANGDPIVDENGNPVFDDLEVLLSDVDDDGRLNNLTNDNEWSGHHLAQKIARSNAAARGESTEIESTYSKRLHDKLQVGKVTSSDFLSRSIAKVQSGIDCGCQTSYNLIQSMVSARVNTLMSQAGVSEETLADAAAAKTEMEATKRRLTKDFMIPHDASILNNSSQKNLYRSYSSQGQTALNLELPHQNNGLSDSIFTQKAELENYSLSERKNNKYLQDSPSKKRDVNSSKAISPFLSKDASRRNSFVDTEQNENLTSKRKRSRKSHFVAENEEVDYANEDNIDRNGIIDNDINTDDSKNSNIQNLSVHNITSRVLTSKIRPSSASSSLNGNGGNTSGSNANARCAQGLILTSSSIGHSSDSMQSARTEGSSFSPSQRQQQQGKAVRVLLDSSSDENKILWNLSTRDKLGILLNDGNFDSLINEGHKNGIDSNENALEYISKNNFLSSSEGLKHFHNVETKPLGKNLIIGPLPPGVLQSLLTYTGDEHSKISSAISKEKVFHFLIALLKSANFVSSQKNTKFTDFSFGQEVKTLINNAMMSFNKQSTSNNSSRNQKLPHNAIGGLVTDVKDEILINETAIALGIAADLNTLPYFRYYSPINSDPVLVPNSSTVNIRNASMSISSSPSIFWSSSQSVASTTLSGLVLRKVLHDPSLILVGQSENQDEKLNNILKKIRQNNRQQWSRETENSSDIMIALNSDSQRLLLHYFRNEYNDGESKKSIEDHFEDFLAENSVLGVAQPLWNYSTQLNTTIPASNTLNGQLPTSPSVISVDSVLEAELKLTNIAMVSLAQQHTNLSLPKHFFKNPHSTSSNMKNNDFLSFDHDEEDIGEEVSEGNSSTDENSALNNDGQEYEAAFSRLLNTFILQSEEANAHLDDKSMIYSYNQNDASNHPITSNIPIRLLTSPSLSRHVPVSCLPPRVAFKILSQRLYVINQILLGSRLKPSDFASVLASTPLPEGFDLTTIENLPLFDAVKALSSISVISSSQLCIPPSARVLSIGFETAKQASLVSSCFKRVQTALIHHLTQKNPVFLETSPQSIQTSNDDKTGMKNTSKDKKIAIEKNKNSKIEEQHLIASSIVDVLPFLADTIIGEDFSQPLMKLLGSSGKFKLSAVMQSLEEQDAEIADAIAEAKNAENCHVAVEKLENLNRILNESCLSEDDENIGHRRQSVNEHLKLFETGRNFSKVASNDPISIVNNNTNALGANKTQSTSLAPDTKKKKNTSSAPVSNNNSPKREASKIRIIAPSQLSPPHVAKSSTSPVSSSSIIFVSPTANNNTPKQSGSYPHGGLSSKIPFTADSPGVQSEASSPSRFNLHQLELTGNASWRANAFASLMKRAASAGSRNLEEFDEKSKSHNGKTTTLNHSEQIHFRKEIMAEVEKMRRALDSELKRAESRDMMLLEDIRYDDIKLTGSAYEMRKNSPPSSLKQNSLTDIDAPSLKARVVFLESLLKEVLNARKLEKDSEALSANTRSIPFENGNESQHAKNKLLSVTSASNKLQKVNSKNLYLESIPQPEAFGKFATVSNAILPLPTAITVSSASKLKRNRHCNSRQSSTAHGILPSKPITPWQSLNDPNFNDFAIATSSSHFSSSNLSLGLALSNAAEYPGVISKSNKFAMNLSVVNPSYDGGSRDRTDEHRSPVRTREGLSFAAAATIGSPSRPRYDKVGKGLSIASHTKDKNVLLSSVNSLPRLD